MQRLIFMLTLAAVTVQAAEPRTDPLPHQQFVIGLSPFLDRGVKDEVYRGIVHLLVEELPLASTLAVYDAFELKSITDVTLPNLRVFNSPKTRANQLASSIQAIKLFLAMEHPKPALGHLSFQDAIRLPQFCEFLAERLSNTRTPVSVLLLGSPLYQDAKEPGFSMVDGYFPSDGHLQAPSERSVFGLGTTNGLRPLHVDWVYFGDPWMNDLHKEKVTRFWTLFLQQRASQLASFSGDLPTALKGFSQGTAGLPPVASRWSIDPQQTKIEMLRTSRQVQLADWITREILPENVPQPPGNLLGPMKIGIRWKQPIDLDLYATPRPGAQTLFFEHPRSPEGYYNRDHRSSPGHDYEFIEFETPVDARKVEAFVNFYKGACPGGAKGEARIEFDGRIYSAPFSIPASEGNLGRSGSDQQPFWSRLPVQGILRIPPAG